MAVLTFPTPTQLKNIESPTANSDAATKGYVDIQVGSGNANFANTAGTVSANAQPNITSVGSLTSLVVIGNITSGNANLGNLVTANFFTGNGSLLTGIITATAANANYASFAGNITTNAQPNITSVGNLTSLNIVGNTTAYHIFPAALNTYDLGSAGVPWRYVYTSVVESLTGNFSGNLSSGNANLGNLVTANFFSGNGSLLTGIIANAANSNYANFAGVVTTNAQPNITSIGTLTSLDVSGTITAANITANTGVFTGNGSGLSALTFGNISNFSNASLTVDELYTQAITRLDVTANGSSGYLFDQYGATNNPALYMSSGQTIAFQLSVSGHPFLIQNSSSANYSVGLSHVTSTGTVTTGASAQGQITGTLYWKVPYGITGNYKYQCSIHGGMNGNIVISDANVSNLTVSAASTVTTAAQPNITSVGTLTSLAVTGNVSGNFFIGNGSQLTGITSSSATTAITVTGNSQPNITSVGNLTSLTVSNSSGIVNFSNTANVSLGSVGNLHITGGSNSFVLSTDGTGNLNWVSVQSGIGMTVDDFVGDGTTTAFTLTTTPLSKDYTIVSLAATFQPRSTYSITGNTLTFSSPPANTSPIEVTIFEPSGGGTANIQILDEGNILTNAVSSINFVGSSVTASNTGNAVTVTISGGSGTTASQVYGLGTVFSFGG